MNKSELHSQCDADQGLIPISDASKRLLDSAISVTETELIDLLDAGGRILAQDIISDINVPPADNSAMDGYAVRSSDFADDEKQRLRISQRICAGQIGQKLEQNTVARIFTGAPIPEGADAVIMQERCEIDDDHMISSGPLQPGTNMRKAGEDIAAGSMILATGHKLKPQDLGLITSIGIATVKVYRRLRVGVFFTGDELKNPSEKLQLGQIYNSNRFTLHGLLNNLGCEVIDLGIVEDTLEATRDALQKAASEADLVMTSGGVSVGEEDYVRIALEELGRLDMWRINIKPGKPLAYGHINKKPFLGMPGNPISVFATFCIFARAYILKMQGATDTSFNRFKVATGFEWPKKGKRCEYVRARIQTNSSGSQTATLYQNQGSGVLTSASWADGLVIIPDNSRIEKGELVEFIPFSELSVY